MALKELIKTRSELEQIADLLSEELKDSDGNTVLRYTLLANDGVSFIDGRKVNSTNFEVNVNKEQMDRGIYTQVAIDDLFPHNIEEVKVARDIQENRFHFCPKGIALPTGQLTFIESVPSNIGIYDDEMREFTKQHENSRLGRRLRVEQRVVVNSKGGRFIESMPFFSATYSHGYMPIPTTRDICVVCTSDDDIKRFPTLIKYLPDPTPDKRVKSSKSFTEAFDELHKISRLKYGTLEEAGIPLSELYDVVMLTGVPIHEIFGHHFEEPIGYLDFGESGTFKFGQNIQNKDIVMQDNPEQTVDGFRILGFTNFDAYGRKREPRAHIKDGKVVGFLGSEYADPEKFKRYMNMEKSEFVGNATQDVDGAFPQPRMSCTVIDGPTHDVDLEGKILLIPHAGHTLPSEKTYMVKAHECYIVKDGEPRRIIPLQVTGGINQALANIMLLNDVSYQVGTCTKPEPIQGTSIAQAGCSEYAKSQVWKGQQVYPLPVSDKHIKALKK